MWLSTRVEPGIFVWEGQVVALIYLSRQPPTHIYTHAFFIIYTFFLFDKLYIYTHTQQQQQQQQQQKSLVLSIKIMFNGDLS